MASRKKSKTGRRKRPLWSLAVVIPLLGLVIAMMITGPKRQKPEFGGPFEMQMLGDKKINEGFLEGKLTFVYFGYTSCPDICPTALTTLSAALDALPEDAQHKTQTLFVSVDPERDIPEDLDDYAKTFHATFHGVTGSRAAIDSMVAAYKAYYKINRDEDPEDYSVDHSALIYLMGRDGRYTTHFKHDVREEDITSTLKELL